MSGGHFDYNNFRISEIADAIDELIRNNRQETEFGEGNNFSAETLEYFNDAAYMLRVASIYANNVDLLVCGDLGEASFEARLNDELERLGKPDE